MSGIVPPEKREYVQGLMDRRNKYHAQADGLQARVDKIRAKIDALDNDIAAACE
jgi:hypothetical protein